MRVGLGLILAIGLLSSCKKVGNGSIGVDLSIAGKEYCREISFPQGWPYPFKDSNGLVYPVPFKEYEFREGNSPAEFLIAGSFETTVFSPPYTTSKYRLNLSAGTPTVVPIDDRTWEQAAELILPLHRKSVFPDRAMAADDQVKFHDRDFRKTGPFWPCCGQIATRLSPDLDWLVLQNITRPGRGKVYFDVFNLSTGSKLVTLEGPLNAIFPDELLDRTGWLAGRYFVIPTGEDFETSVICEFDRRTK